MYLESEVQTDILFFKKNASDVEYDYFKYVMMQ
jgi:hypothetical protein